MKDEIIKYRGKFYLNSEEDGTSYYLENNGLSEGLWGCPTKVNKTPDTGIGVQGYVFDFDIPPSHERIALMIKELSISLYLEKNEARIADLLLQVESKDDIINTLQKKFKIDEDEMENILNE